jgi:hypothetical protein
MTSDIISLHGARIQTRAIRSTAKALQVSIKVLQSLDAARPIAEELVTVKELADDLLGDISTLDDRLSTRWNQERRLRTTDAKPRRVFGPGPFQRCWSFGVTSLIYNRVILRGTSS